MLLGFLTELHTHHLVLLWCPIFSLLIESTREHTCLGKQFLHVNMDILVTALGEYITEKRCFVSSSAPHTDHSIVVASGLVDCYFKLRYTLVEIHMSTSMPRG